jgi:hypothetical protein
MIKIININFKSIYNKIKKKMNFVLYVCVIYLLTLTVAILAQEEFVHSFAISFASFMMEGKNTSPRVETLDEAAVPAPVAAPPTREATPPPPTPVPICHLCSAVNGLTDWTNLDGNYQCKDQEGCIVRAKCSWCPTGVGMQKLKVDGMFKCTWSCINPYNPNLPPLTFNDNGWQCRWCGESGINLPAPTPYDESSKCGWCGECGINLSGLTVYDEDWKCRWCGEYGINLPKSTSHQGNLSCPRGCLYS